MPKKRRILSQKEIEDIVLRWDTISDDENFADSDSDCLESSFNENVDEIRKNRFLSVEDDENVTLKDAKLEKFEWHKECKSKSTIHEFKAHYGIKIQMPENAKEIDFFELFFNDEILQILTEETNRYEEQNRKIETGTESVTKRSHHIKWKEMKNSEMMRFLAVTLLFGHVEKDKIEDYWSSKEILETPYFRRIMSLDRFKQILKYLHFTDNENAPSKTDENYDRLWKLRSLFETLIKNFKSAYNPAKNCVVDEVIVTFKGRVIFRQYIPKKHKRWGIKIYKLCDENAYTFDMKVYLGRDRTETVEGKSAAESVVISLIQDLKGKGHNLFIDNFFTSPLLLKYLTDECKINACGTVRKNRKNMPKDLCPKKRGDIVSAYSDGLCAVTWKDKRDVYVLSTFHDGSRSNESNNEANSKPKVIESYNKNMGFVDLSDRMANSYGFARKTLKWPKKLFFHFLNIAVLNAFILFNDNAVRRESHRNFRLNLIEQILHKYSDGSTLKRPLKEVENTGHWPIKAEKRRRCAQCSKQKKETKTWIVCNNCNVGLCLGDCYRDFHIKNS